MLKATYYFVEIVLMNKEQHLQYLKNNIIK